MYNNRYRTSHNVVQVTLLALELDLGLVKGTMKILEDFTSLVQFNGQPLL
jgi:hypothetical protein